jgi:L-alanine-DL-glutamate epimerase-like enolase superfamily enzyme
MITELRVTPRTVPLPRPWGPDVPVNHVLVVEVVLDDGRTGTGFCWTPRVGAAAVRALLETDVRDALLGPSRTPRWCGTGCGRTCARRAPAA